ncbi:response regulator [Pseudomonas sp. Marseille-P9899]|uniref:response regulator n=1 Tax=Pseudomonas sp. Marseille-P9899 TaxID=2730401 RepID=UPI00158BBFEB|nr:response regulator [Pseudomonas sp. Marseille-P9899]
MRVLLVEDDQALAQGIRAALRGEGYTLDCLADGLDAERALRDEAFDLVLLDLGLPRRDGLSLLRQVRARPDGQVPVLVLTARDATSDRIQGLDAGADDYLVKPFDVDELKARIRALLRRSQGRANPVLSQAGVSLAPARHEVRYRDQPVTLTPMEFQLLHQLLARPGTVLTRERLADALYGWQEAGPGNTLEVLIHNLRRKLDSGLIRTVRGVGYLIESP